MSYQPGEILLGKYRIAPGEALGHGAFGDVYLVTHNTLIVELAIKVLRQNAPGIGSKDYIQASERFLFEARLGARIQHANVIKVYEFDDTQGQLCLVMEYAPGKSLQYKLKESGALSIAQTVRLGLELCAGLEAIHNLHVIHRDLKPGNILFGQDGSAKIGDLGLAQMENDESRGTLFGSGDRPGTPLYMSPEQENTNAMLLPTSDIFSLGCVLFECLTGKPYKRYYGTRVSEHRAGVPGWLAKVIERMLREQPGRVPGDDADLNKRYRLVSQVRAALQRGQEPRRRGSWVLVLGGLGLLLGAFLVGRMLAGAPAAAPAALAGTPLVEVAVTQASSDVAAATEVAATRVPTHTAVPVLSPTLLPTSVPTYTALPVLGVGLRQTRSEDGMEMVYVPSGTFGMGSENGDSDEVPVHQVNLDAYWIDRTEVTNGMYAQCIQAGVCTPPTKKSSLKQTSYYGNSQFADYPVIYVDWNQAKAYCEWAGARLPSEAEWEYAARGADGRTYPWGEGIDSSRANYAGQDTKAVGSYASGASPYGALDMAGNVWEWVADWYGPYAVGSVSNPTGPASGDVRVLRGGSWVSYDDYARSADRNWSYPASTGYGSGFRCSRSLPF